MERNMFSLLLCYPYSFGAQRKHVSTAVGDASDDVELATTHQRREVPVGSAAAELHQRRSAVPAGRITDVLSESNRRASRRSGLFFQLFGVFARSQISRDEYHVSGSFYKPEHPRCAHRSKRPSGTGSPSARART